MIFPRNISGTGHLRIIRSVYERYRVANLKVVGKPTRLRAPNGELKGYVEEISSAAGRVTIRGWSTLPQVKVTHGTTVETAVPSIERNDVADAIGCDPHVGFLIDVPLEKGSLTIEAGDVGHPSKAKLSLGSPAPGIWDMLRLQARFVFDLASLTPQIARFVVRSDPDAAKKIKHKLKLVANGDQIALLHDRSLKTEPSGVHPQEAGVVATIVMPVFNAFEILPEALRRVAENTPKPWHLILVEDHSTDERIRAFLTSWKEQTECEGAQITIVWAEENKGFVESANTGLAAAVEASSGPVILLNSDAFVPPGWSYRLLQPFADDPEIATTTPLSNEAEILTVPAISGGIPLDGLQVDQIDATLAKNISPGFSNAEDLPTGIGFCLAMSPDFIKEIGVFDTAFGRGYGEEVDWCQRAAARGGRHVAVSNLFVGHVGGVSFGSKDKRIRIRNNNLLISSRYPHYDGLVARFIRTDPLATPRMVGALALLNSLPGSPSIPVFVAHSMGGGADIWLTHRLSRPETEAAVVLRLGGVRKYVLEVHVEGRKTIAGTDDPKLVLRLMQVLRRKHFVYSCAVGHTDPLGLPDLLRQLSADSELEVLFHDFYPISPSYTLLDNDLVYRGVPNPKTASASHALKRSDGAQVTLHEWQNAWAPAMRQASRITTFSTSSRDIVAAAYPFVENRISVTPHPLNNLPAPANITSGSASNLGSIGVLGNIGPQKGAAIVCEMARLLARRKTDDFDRIVVLGRLDRVSSFPRPSVVHGPYEHKDIESLIRRYNIRSWLLPSIWPETFSFTVHECLATGLPVYAFDLGAQGDAVAQAENGHLLTLPRHKVPSGEIASQVLEAMSEPQSYGSQVAGPAPSRFASRGS